MMYAELIGNYKKCRIKNLYDNRIVSVEYGSKEMYAQPYLQPAKRELEDTLPDLYVEALEEELRQ